MKTTISGRTLVIKFSYSEYDPLPETDPKSPKRALKKVHQRRTCTCYAKPASDVPGQKMEISHQASVKNDSRQKFNYGEARKRSLAKLLNEMGIHRADRAIVWQDFFEQCPNTVEFVNKKTPKRLKKTAEVSA